MEKLRTGETTPFRRRFRKLLMIMRLLFALIFLTLMQVSASTYSQNTRLSLKLENAGFTELFSRIKQQSEFTFVYNVDDVERLGNISCEFQESTVEQILDQCLKSTGMTYEVRDKVVVLAPRETLAINKRPVDTGQPQVRTISGTVTDTGGQPLPGVSVVVKGTTAGTVTDANGEFSLRIPIDAESLQFSFVGMRTEEVAVEDRTTFSIVMEEETFGIEEVVAVGYGTQKKLNVTGAIDVITNVFLENRQASTVSQLLQGQSSGMTFSVDNFGFQPGAEMNIDIRGIGSLNGGEPYILIDGIPGDMNRLNPEDIESISVLKDAAASAIFGARAPYGVVLITTKSGQTDKKISITYSGSITHATPAQLPRMLDSYTHARVLNEAGENGRVGTIYTNGTVDRIIAFQEGNIDYIRQFTVPDATHFETIPANSRNWISYGDANANYDWFDEFYGSALNHKQNLTVEGGSKSTTYYFSAGFLGQEGVLNYGTDNYNRINVMGKLKTAITDWWDFTYQPRFMKSTRVYPNMDRQGTYDLIFHQIARTMPMTPKYNGYGNYSIQSLMSIPVLEDAGTNTTEVTENWHSFSTALNPAKGWEVNADFAYRAEDYFRSDVGLTIYEQLVDKSLRALGTTDPSNIRQRHHSNNYWTTNVYSTYNFNIKDRHNFGILAGAQLEQNIYRELDARKNDLIVEEVLSLQTALGEPVVIEDLSHWATQGYFSRLTYNYDEKYLFEANIRRDGTSRFQKGNRWGTFPSFSVGWIISKENFWSPMEDMINLFKLRGSWGSLGNQNVSPYQDLNLIPLQTSPLNWIFSYGQTRPIGYTGTPSLVSPHLTWETATTKNLGINTAFLGNRLQADFDWFERVTTDMIGPSEAQPGVLGASLPQANNSTLRTRGWELVMRWNHNVNRDFSYFANLNLYDSKSVVTKYLNPTGTLSTWYEGREQGEIWGYTAYDLYRSQEEVDAYLASVDLTRLWDDGPWLSGDVKYEDINSDGYVDNGSNTLDDHGDLSIIGNSTPHYQFGFSAGFNFKGFDFSMLWKGTLKRDLAFSSNIDENMFWGFTVWNRSSVFPEHLDYYRDKEGDKYSGLYEGEANINLDAYWPRPYLHTRENNKNRFPSTRYLQSGAYARLQNVQLGYNFSDKLLNQLHLSRLRVYVSAENLVTFHKLPVKGIDPVAIGGSWGTGKTYGADRLVSLGLIVTL